MSAPKKAAPEGASDFGKTEAVKGAKGEPRRVSKRVRVARTVTLLLVFAAVIVSLAFDSGLGTPSAFGIGSFSLLCPLGGIESMVASKAFIPTALISLAIVVAFTLLFGRAWCAWGCPAPVIRHFFRREPKTEGVESKECACGEAPEGEPTPAVRDHLARIGRDRRTWVFVAVVVAVLIAGLPLFCLVCPIGLTFGTVGSLWHLIVDKQMTLSALVFPVALVVELVLYRKWCANLCPIAGFLNILGCGARLFRPRVNRESCSRCSRGSSCHACAASCPEGIDLHAPDAQVRVAECTRCGECAIACPTGSIRFTQTTRPLSSETSAS